MTDLRARALVTTEEMCVQAHAAPIMRIDPDKHSNQQRKGEKRSSDHQNNRKSVEHDSNGIGCRQKANKHEHESDDDDDDDALWEPVATHAPSSSSNWYRKITQTPRDSEATKCPNAPARGIVRKSSKVTHIKKKRQTNVRQRRVNRPEHNHPPHAKEILREWFYGNLHAPGGPYPSDEVKDDLALKTGLTRIQISNFYINERKRFPEWRRSTAHVSPRSGLA
jgi:hypothetical protein